VKNVDSRIQVGYSWRKKRWQCKTALDGDKWSVAYVPPGVIRHYVK